MSKIKILKEEISNRIAAGEVIERPASVVKELVDNSIDSGANKIQISIQNGGASLIQVVDNGCGMDQDDALMCLEAHATSKIRDVNDLENITTFGFRGEALPSIASVSRFTLLTREHSAIEGTRVQCEGGTIQAVETTGCPPGTSITIKNLFYNVPARKKFMRSQATEEAHIHETVLLLALSRLDIHIELKFNNRLIFSIPPADDIRTRASLLFGKALAKELVPVNFVSEGISITGLCSRAATTRKNRKEQRSFINGRPVQAPSIYQGIKEAYTGRVEKGTFPPCLLYYIMNPNRVDINVHPAKREVRFNENRLITQITEQAILQALEEELRQDEQIAANTAPETNLDFSNLEEELPAEFLDHSFSKEEQEEAKQASWESHRPDGNNPESLDVSSANHEAVSAPSAIKATPKPFPQIPPSPKPNVTEIKPDISRLKPNIPKASGSIAPTANLSNLTFNDLTIIGQYSKKMILCESPAGLVIINVNAARERILFEELRHQMENKDIPSQSLLIPVNLDLPQSDVLLLKKFQDKICSIGFEIEHFGGNTFILSAVPSNYPQTNLQQVIFDLIDQLRENPDGLKRQAENMLIQLISKSTVRRQKKLNDIEIKGLLSELAQCQHPYSCPQGKPVVINFSENDLNRRFGLK